MKNETNTQHTPAPWSIQSKGVFDEAVIKAKVELPSGDSGYLEIAKCDYSTYKIAIASQPHIQADITFLDELEKANAQLIARAPALLKENEQLKKEVEYQKFYCQKELSRKNDLYLSLEEINREMLEALKSARYELTLCMGMATEQDEKDATKHVIEKVKSAIAKAETKTLVGS